MGEAPDVNADRVVEGDRAAVPDDLVNAAHHVRVAVAAIDRGLNDRGLRRACDHLRTVQCDLVAADPFAVRDCRGDEERDGGIERADRLGEEGDRLLPVVVRASHRCLSPVPHHHPVEIRRSAIGRRRRCEGVVRTVHLPPVRNLLAREPAEYPQGLHRMEGRQDLPVLREFGRDLYPDELPGGIPDRPPFAVFVLPQNAAEVAAASSRRTRSTTRPRDNSAGCAETRPSRRRKRLRASRLPQVAKMLRAGFLQVRFDEPDDRVVPRLLCLRPEIGEVPGFSQHVSHPFLESLVTGPRPARCESRR